jgi:hypothetical protein
MYIYDPYDTSVHTPYRLLKYQFWERSQLHFGLAFLMSTLNRVLIFRFQLLAVYVLLVHNCGECRIKIKA